MLGQLPSDREHRMQRGHRVLEDHPDVAPRDRAQVASTQPEEILSAEDRTPLDDRAGRQQTEQREHRHRLAAATLTGDTEDLARFDLVVDAVDDRRETTRRRQLDTEPFDLEQSGHCRLVTTPRRLRIEKVAEAVAEEVEGEHGGEDREPGERADPPPLEVLGAVGDHRAPLGLRRLGAEAEERQAGEQQDRVREVECREHEHRPGDVRQHVAEERAARRGAEQAGRLDVFRIPDRQHQAAHDSRIRGPRDHDDRQRCVLEPTPEHGRNDHREDDRRKREDQVDHAHREPVHDAAEVAGNRHRRARR